MNRKYDTLKLIAMLVKRVVETSYSGELSGSAIAALIDVSTGKGAQLKKLLEVEKLLNADGSLNVEEARKWLSKKLGSSG
ncbi:MAG: hypothetical protein ACP5IZ_11235 [Thermoprotei archaeon]